MAWNPNWANAIASIESQGSGGYSAVGPRTAKGNRAYGKYQVMDFNIPAWTKKHLGRELSPEQFLNSPEAQDAVFQGEFGSSVQKYGNPQDAASVWFTGRPASQGAGRSDILGTTGAGYVNKFNAALGSGITTSTQGTAPMMQQQKPRGLLESIGIQKMEEGAEGETGQRFYQRDSFKDTAAILAQGFGRMGIMGMEEIADGIAQQRTENKARNKTIEMLRGMPNGEELVKLAEIAGPAAVAQQVLAQQFKGAEKVTPSSAIGKLQSDLASGLIDKEQYKVALANMAPKGMRIVSDGHGGFTMEQGVGVGNDGRMAPSDPSFMLKAIDDILADPALDTSTGIMSPLQNVPGTPQYRFGTRARQLQGQAFLQAFESLKGGGQITEIEGQKAEAAIGRLDTAQSPEDYRNALAELRSVLDEAQKRARQPSSAPNGVIEYDATGKRITR